MNKEEGFALVQKWKDSRVTQRQFAQAHGISLNTLRHYSRMINPRQTCVPSPTSLKQFVELRPVFSDHQNWIIIKFPSGIEVQLDPSTDLSTVLEGIKQL